MQYIIK